MLIACLLSLVALVFWIVFVAHYCAASLCLPLRRGSMIAKKRKGVPRLCVGGALEGRVVSIVYLVDNGGQVRL